MRGIFKQSAFLKINKFLFSKNENFILFIFSITNLLLLLRVIGSDPRLTVLFFLTLIFIIYKKTSDIIISSLLVGIYTFQFYAPNKYYLVEILKTYETILEQSGYILGYGVNLENIFLLLTCLFIVRKIIIKKEYLYKVRFTGIIPIIISSAMFFLTGLYSSMIHSPFLPLSNIWLVQFMQMFLVGFILFYIYITSKKNFDLIYPVISVSILFQGIVGILQFINQSWVSLPVESFRFSSMYYGASDAVDTVFRIPGTFAHPNQLGLLIIIMMVVLVPQVIKTKKIIYSISLLLGFLIVLLTQSRASWISLIPVSLLFVFAYKNSLALFIKNIGIRKIVIIMSLVILATSAVVIPRTLRSFNAFYIGAGVPLRLEMAKEAAFGIALSPWVGYGAGTNEAILYSLFPKGYNYSFPAPVHLGYLQFILEFGFLGFIFFTFSFVYILRQIFNSYFLGTAKHITEIKDFILITVGGTLVFTFYYLFQPHEGIREFAYLGIILGYGIICAYLLTTKQNEK